MATKRIDYIDWLKGLSIICVVWFHAPHPEWINFSFRMPLFFLLSGIFFKIVPFRTYAARKTNQLLVPFVVFYVIYYFYMMLEYRISPTHADTEFDPGVFLDLFATHKDTTGFTVNTPLWFIAALINLQVMLHVLMKTLRRPWLVMTVALAVSAAGFCWLRFHESYFMFSRSLQFLGYYTFGHLYGKRLLRTVESGVRGRSILTGVSLAVMALAFLPATGEESPGQFAATYAFNISLVLALIVLFRYVSRVPALGFFHFFGRNSYVVLGLHYMLIQLAYSFMAIYGIERTQTMGLCILVATLLLLWPVINAANRYCPQLVGRQEAIDFGSLKRRILSLR